MKVHYASVEDINLTPCTIEVLVLGKSVFVRETYLKDVEGKMARWKQKWKLTALSPLGIKGKPAHLAFKSEGDGFYNSISLRGRVLNRIVNSKVRGPREYDEEGNLIQDK